MQRSGKRSKDEIAKLTAQMEKRHAEELKQLDQGGGVGGSTAAAAVKGSSSTAKAASSTAAAAAAPAAADPLSKFLKGLTVDSSEAAAQPRVSRVLLQRESSGTDS